MISIFRFPDGCDEVGGAVHHESHLGLLQQGEILGSLRLSIEVLPPPPPALLGEQREVVGEAFSGEREDSGGENIFVNLRME